jgi:hypothetical protein
VASLRCKFHSRHGLINGAGFVLLKEFNDKLWCRCGLDICRLISAGDV